MPERAIYHAFYGKMNGWDDWKLLAKPFLIESELMISYCRQLKQAAKSF